MIAIPPRHLTYLLFVIALVASIIVVRYLDPLFLRTLRFFVFDIYQQLDPRPYNSNVPVRVVDIDEPSIAKMGQWPWPRTKLAELVKVLEEQGASVIAFDILFAEPDRTSIEQIVKQLPAEQAKALAIAVAEQPTNDEVFARALQASPSVLAISLGEAENTQFTPKSGFVVAGEDPRPFISRFTGASTSRSVLDASAHGVGAFNWTPDRDQIVRRVALIFRVGETLVPSLAAEALRVAQAASTYVLKASNANGETAFGQSTGLNHLRVGDIEIPTDNSGSVYLKFRRFESSSFIPSWKVIARQVPREEIEGRIIFVGTSAPGLLDLRATPLDSAIPGVDIHAQGIENILEGTLLTRPDYSLALEEFTILIMGIGLAALLPRVSATVAAAIGLTVVGLIIVGSWLAFKLFGFLFDASFPSMAMSMITAGVTTFTYHGVEQQRSQIREAFGRYLAPAVVAEMIANPEKLTLGGEQRDITLMFCDVRNFTTISQDMSATDLIRFINEVLGPLSEIILKYRGTIDKYMGDSIMAFWNAPVEDAHHTFHASCAAIEMIKKMSDLNDQWQFRDQRFGKALQTVKIGIGINTGFCSVGNIGSAHHFDYSAIGDEVNITSRFESLTKLYGVDTILGQRAVAPGFSALELDSVMVKGRSRSTKIYTFSELLNAAPSQLEALVPAYARFLEAYRGGQWSSAERLLNECRATGVMQLDTCFSLFENRIEQFRHAPPPGDWDGSISILEK